MESTTRKTPREIMGPRADGRTGSSPVGKCTVEEHARKRIESIYLQCRAFHNLFPNSSNIKLEFKGAELQGQKASEGNHACHFNPFSNLKTNLRERVTQQVGGGDLTPGTRKCLSVFGLDSSGYKKMKTGKTKEHVHRVLDDHLIVDVLDVKTRELAVQLCGTDSLPEHVNHTDSNMEKYVKPLALDVFKRLLVGEILPNEATERLQELIKNHFVAAIKRIKSVENAYKLAIQEARELINDPSKLEIKKKTIGEQLKIIKTPKKPGLAGEGVRSPKYNIKKSLLDHLVIWQEKLKYVVIPRLNANVDQLRGTEAFSIPDSVLESPDTLSKAQGKIHRVRESAKKKLKNQAPNQQSPFSSTKRKLPF